MFSKNNQRSKLIIPQIRRQGSKGKVVKRQENEHLQYGTDQKRQLDRSIPDVIEQNDSSSCSHCRARISQFVTKKPTHPIDKGVQTNHKPFLIDLIQERVEGICANNARLTKLLQDREDELLDRQQEISQIEDKFTTILLGLAQQVATGRKSEEKWHQLKKTFHYDSDTPAYLKALQFDC